MSYSVPEGYARGRGRVASSEWKWIQSTSKMSVTKPYSPRCWDSVKLLAGAVAGLQRLR